MCKLTVPKMKSLEYEKVKVLADGGRLSVFALINSAAEAGLFSHGI